MFFNQNTNGHICKENFIAGFSIVELSFNYKNNECMIKIYINGIVGYAELIQYKLRYITCHMNYFRRCNIVLSFIQII